MNTLLSLINIEPFGVCLTQLECHYIILCEVALRSNYSSFASSTPIFQAFADEACAHTTIPEQVLGAGGTRWDVGW